MSTAARFEAGGAPTVCAVVPAGVALARQTRPPDDVVVAQRDRSGLADAVRAAAERAAWLWLVDARVNVAPDALAELLAPLREPWPLGDPVLISSKVVTPDGRLDDAAPPWPRLLAREQAMAGAERHLAALRAARYGSLLVHSRAVERHGVPRPDFAGAGDDLEWTARVLRDEPGFLAPRSVAVRTADGRPDAAAFVCNRVRILRGDGWRGQEKAWFAFLFAQDLSRELAARPASAVRVVRAIGRGLRAGA